MKYESLEELAVYDEEIPSFVGGELERLYGSRYACLLHIQLSSHPTKVSTFTIRATGGLTAVFLFLKHKGIVTILNEGILLKQNDISTFSSYIFTRYAAVKAIRMNAIECSLDRLEFIYHRMPCASDTIMRLPDSCDQWMLSLSAHFRGAIKRNLKQLNKNEATFRFDLLEKDAVHAPDLHKLIELNRSRMLAKKKTPSLDIVEESRIVEFTRQCGFVGTIRIEGRICAGAILYRLGNNYSLRLLSHHSAYNKFSIGTTALYLTIQEAIKNGGGGTFFFGWGDEDYKFRLGARRRILYQVVLYRNYLAVLSNLPLLIRAVCTSTKLRARSWVGGLKGK